MSRPFELQSDYAPAGDQPAAIEQLIAGVQSGLASQILLGVTGSGKTFTMTGSTANYKYRGLVPRGINSIFSEVGGRFDNAISVKISFVEIYNELMFDMLASVPPHE